MLLGFGRGIRRRCGIHRRSTRRLSIESYGLEADRGPFVGWGVGLMSRSARGTRLLYAAAGADGTAQAKALTGEHASCDQLTGRLDL